MEFLVALGGWPGARWLQGSATAYLLVNAGHILGIGLILGAVLPLDARLLGLAATVPMPMLVPFLSRTAALGVALALLTGLWLFTVRPAEYLANTAFLVKIGLLALALANVGWQHASGGYRRVLAGLEPTTAVRLRAFASMLLWLGTLLAGRWIGFL
ncbi:DUF2214 domain-containing protein [Ancylobacter defluvii]|uniref:DUF2214 domain-containing protein n=1 Tax=Ancylobacter defluvii TaxID=1282440 RepID=A0A9W6JW84_9HYPH|nr:DUF2214 domain-containing protein [Ancylobacter defluvii]MBS7589418.1 DUF2214 domain-containing protein [Ancylobacter defluvii]GLK85035.1 hypothetical protein GCM10017653_31050 [Ancylobacter defluvii]